MKLMHRIAMSVLIQPSRDNHTSTNNTYVPSLSGAKRKMMNLTWIFLECKFRKTFLANMRQQKYVAEAEEAY